MDRVEYIRMKEREYHDDCYDNYKLFQEGTWLYKPVKTIINELNRFRNLNTFHVLDLGCGVGRNSIPIAMTLKHRKGKVVCVDILDSALTKLEEYSREHDVIHYIDIRKSDIEEFSIYEDEYDMIVAVSSLEHLRTKNALKTKLYEMKKGTKINGSNCIIINSSISEIDKETDDILNPLFEINIPTQEMLVLLDNIYVDWEIEKRIINHQTFDIERGERSVLLETDYITYVATKSND